MEGKRALVVETINRLMSSSNAKAKVRADLQCWCRQQAAAAVLLLKPAVCRSGQ